MKRLLQFQSQIGAISKDSTNPFYHSRYFDINKLIESVTPVLTANDLVVLQPLSEINGKPAIRTIIIGASDGLTLVDEKTIIPELSDPQKMGAVITYFRRYALQSILLLGAEDDDANSAVKPPASYNAPQTTQTSYQRPPVTLKTPYSTPVNTTLTVGSECKKCGSKIVKWTSGKVGCSGKCWLPENAHLITAYNNSKVSIEDFGVSDKTVAEIFPN